MSTGNPLPWARLGGEVIQLRPSGFVHFLQTIQALQQRLLLRHPPLICLLSLSTETSDTEGTLITSNWPALHRHKIVAKTTFSAQVPTGRSAQLMLSSAQVSLCSGSETVTSMLTRSRPGALSRRGAQMSQTPNHTPTSVYPLIRSIPRGNQKVAVSKALTPLGFR